MKKILICLSLCLFISCSNIKSKFQDYDLAKILIDNTMLTVEVVLSPHAKSIGLSKRKFLTNDGMLFLFDRQDQLSFWMKDMEFPIDIVWIKNDKVVNITHNATVQKNVPDNLLQIYNSIYFADTVLELNAGDAKKYNLKKGVKFKILEKI